jgi:hypothetical protein
MVLSPLSSDVVLLGKVNTNYLTKIIMIANPGGFGASLGGSLCDTSKT